MHGPDSTPWIQGTGIWIFCQWNLDSRFQSLAGCRIYWAVFRIPKSRILDPQSKFFRIPESGVPYMGEKTEVPLSAFVKRSKTNPGPGCSKQSLDNPGLVKNVSTDMKA